MKTFSQGASFIHSSQYPGALLSREEKEPQRALAYHSCSPGLCHLPSELSFFFPKSFSLSNMVILSLKKTSVQKDDSIWNTLKSMSQMSKPPMWFVGTKYIFLHSEKRLLYPKMRSLSRDRPSSGVVFRCIQSSGLSPI